MNYITNKDHISTAALHDPNYLSHGLSWGKHRYVRREGSPGNYRYIYPEDLRNAGQNLASGAKNLVSRAGTAVSSAARNAGQAVGRATGFTQRKEMQRTQAQHRVAEARLNRSMQEYDGSEGANRRFSVAARQESRADENAMNARIAYSKTPLAKAEAAIKNAPGFIKDLPSDVSYEVKQFLSSSVGVGQRKTVNNYRAELDRAKDALENANLATEAGRVASRNFDKAYSDYRNALSNYGETFFGSIRKMLGATPFR